MRHLLRPIIGISFFVSLLGSAACSDDDQADGGTETTGGQLEVPESYTFDSRFEDSSSVSYSGQVFRQALIIALSNEISSIQDQIDNDAKVFDAGEVRARLEFYYRFDSATAGELPHRIETSPATLQSSWNDISSDKDLQAKLAGQDPIGQHKDWATEFGGWQGAANPDQLVLDWFDELDAMAVAYSSGTIPTSPSGAPITKWYVDGQGRDYQQLLQKFLLGAINYSQGTDDYLDDDLEAKGLNADNVEPDEGKPYTALEHAWDEGFGYWGAARDYLAYEDATLAATAAQDHDADGAIDLTSEYNFGASINASKRDAGASPDAPTDFSGEGMTAFLTGRAIISNAHGPLSSDDLAALQAQRDIAVLAWERSLAATAVHYVNDTLADLNDPSSAHEDLAKHWSELKGFALMLQFNPRKQLSDTQFSELHELLGDQIDADTSAYQTKLIAARDILAEAYDFDPANLGDDAGAGGW